MALLTLFSKPLITRLSPPTVSSHTHTHTLTLFLSPRLKHRLEFADEKTVMVAKDANIQNEDTFDIYDPRNPINKRRRDEGVAEAKRIRENSLKERAKR